MGAGKETELSTVVIIVAAVCEGVAVNFCFAYIIIKFFEPKDNDVPRKN